MNPDLFSLLFNPQTLAGPSFGHLLATNPEGAAASFASAGIPPPDLSKGAQLTNSAANDFYNAVGIPASVTYSGRSQPAVGNPLDIRSPAQLGESGNVDPLSSGGSPTTALSRALQGVKAPAAPTPQKISSPNLPSASPISSVPIAALLKLLEGGQTAAPPPNFYRLNQAVGR